MDPNQTFEELCETIVHDDSDSVIELASALEDWFKKGGAVPELSQAHMSAACEAIIQLTFAYYGRGDEEYLEGYEGGVNAEE